MPRKEKNKAVKKSVKKKKPGKIIGEKKILDSLLEEKIAARSSDEDSEDFPENNSANVGLRQIQPTKISPVLERVAQTGEINLEQAVFQAQIRDKEKEEGVNYLNVSRDYSTIGGGKRDEQRKVQYAEQSVSYDTMLEKKKEEKETRKIMDRNIGGEWRERTGTWDMESQTFIKGEKKEEEDTRKYMARGDYQ